MPGTGQRDVLCIMYCRPERLSPCASSSLMIGRAACSGVAVPGVEDPREEAREMTEAILPSLVVCEQQCQWSALRSLHVWLPGWRMHEGAQGRRVDVDGIRQLVP